MINSDAITKITVNCASNVYNMKSFSFNSYIMFALFLLLCCQKTNLMNIHFKGVVMMRTKQIKIGCLTLKICSNFNDIQNCP